MTHAVTHFLVAAIIVNIIRDYVVKNKRTFPLHLVLIGGVAGLLPDFDVAAYWILHYAGFTINEVHRTFTHTIFFGLLFILLGFIFWNTKSKTLSERHLKLRNIFLVIALGIFIHLVLDALVAGYVLPLYPILTFMVGLNLIQYLPEHFREALLPSLDAVLLIIWMVYLELKHKISSFI